MAVNEQINLGVVGACARGGHFREVLEAIESLRVHAICDINGEVLEKTAKDFSVEERFRDYEEMVTSSNIDAVLIGTPMQFHAPQAITALKNNIHVFSEVTAGVSIDECKALVAAANDSDAVYMMGENYLYTKQNCIITELVKAGLFGEPIYAEAEYIHELKGLNRDTPWRRKWQTGINGITYGTHSLGPILQWMPGDRVVSVCCAGSGHHYKDLDGNAFEAEDTCIMLCKMASGVLVKVRLDMITDRPHSTSTYQYQGYDGCYESGRGAAGDIDRIWLRSRSKDVNDWLDLRTLEDEFLPEAWRAAPPAAINAGHGGGDYFELIDFVSAIKGDKPCPVGIHEAMDMTLPGLCSQASIAESSKWIDVPDSRTW